MSTSKDSTDSMRAPMPTHPDEITRTRIDRLERKQAVQTEQIHSLASAVSESRRENQEGFKMLQAELKSSTRERTDADTAHAIQLVRQEAEQVAQRKELEAMAKSSARGSGAITGLGAAGVIEAISRLVDYIRHAGGH